MKHSTLLGFNDDSTELGRAKERYRRIILTSTVSGTARVVSIVTSLITIPLALNYLGNEGYGIWMTISSLINILSLADFGIGNGLISAISSASGSGDRQACKKYVSSAFFMLLAISFIIFLAFMLVYPNVSWSKIFNISSDRAIKEAGLAVAAWVGCLIVNIIVGIAQKVYWGFQEGYINDFCYIVGPILSLAGVLLIIHADGGLPWLVFVSSAGQTISLTFNFLYLFFFKRIWLMPRFKFLDLFYMKKLVKLGISFFALNIAITVTAATDNIVNAQLFGASAVAEYSIISRLFSVIGVVLNIVTIPLWPAYGEAIARGDIGWVRKAFFKSILVSLFIASICSLGVIIFASDVTYLWVKQTFVWSPLFLLGFGLLAVISALENPIVALLNGAQAIRIQSNWAVIMAGASVCGKLVLGYSYGLTGIIWANVIAHIVFFLVPLTLFIYHSPSKLFLQGRGRPC